MLQVTHELIIHFHPHPQLATSLPQQHGFHTTKLAGRLTSWTTKAGDKHHWPQETHHHPHPDRPDDELRFRIAQHDQYSLFASAGPFRAGSRMVRLVAPSCADECAHSAPSDECYNLPVIAEGSVTDSAPQQRPVPRQRRSSWKRKAVVAWKDGTGALRRINNRRNSHIPSGFEMVASRFSWIYIQGRR